MSAFQARSASPVSGDGSNDIRARYRDLLGRSPVRHRDAAAALGVSEYALLAAHADAYDPAAADPPGSLKAFRLRSDWPMLLRELEQVGEVMALTRNAECVHEKTGIYAPVAAADGARQGLVVGPEIDLRVFFHAWKYGLAVNDVRESRPVRVMQSFQFFDATGTAVHKIYARPGTDRRAWNRLAVRMLHEDPVPELPPGTAETADAVPVPRPTDVDQLREDWAALGDTHDFVPMLRRHGLTRLQALQLADPCMVQAVPTASAHTALTMAAGTQLPIMVFVENPGVIQIHTGRISRVNLTGPWVNVQDPRFNLHLRQTGISEAFIVRKPTRDGVVTSLELFDTRGECIAMFFGERKPGRPELPAWRELVRELLDDPDGEASER